MRSIEGIANPDAGHPAARRAALRAAVGAALAPAAMEVRACGA